MFEPTLTPSCPETASAGLLCPDFPAETHTSYNRNPVTPAYLLYFALPPPPVPTVFAILQPSPPKEAGATNKTPGGGNKPEGIGDKVGGVENTTSIGGGDGGDGGGGAGSAVRTEFRGRDQQAGSSGGRRQQRPRPRSAVARVETTAHHGKVNDTVWFWLVNVG